MRVNSGASVNLFEMNNSMIGPHMLGIEPLLGVYRAGFSLNRLVLK